jgi:hypothetical protein
VALHHLYDTASMHEYNIPSCGEIIQQDYSRNLRKRQGK